MQVYKNINDDQFRKNVDIYIAESFDKKSYAVYEEENKKREKFVADFPMEKISDMQLEDYALGMGNKECFCNRLENELDRLGDMSGSNSSKFGIYYSKSNNSFMVVKKFGQADNIGEAFDNLRTTINELLVAGKNKDYYAIQQNKLSQMYKGKLLSTYYPEEYICVFSREHIIGYLNLLGIAYDAKKYFSVEKKKALLLNIKQWDERLANFNNYLIMDFLYKMYRHSLPDVKDESEIDTNNIEVVDLNYIKQHLSVRGSKVGVVGKDYLKANQLKKNQGERAECSVLYYEKNLLEQNGKQDLASKVEWSSKEKGDGLGYDIKSYFDDGREKYIEVKSKNSYNNVLDIYITENELDFLRNNRESSFIYYVFKHNNKIKLHIVNWDYIKEYWIKPTQYRITVDVTENPL